MPLQRSDKYKIEADGKEHRLIINDVHDRDIGQYSAECKGKETSAKLDVEGKIPLRFPYHRKFSSRTLSKQVPS